MLRKVLPVLALLAVPAIASAQFEAGDYELTLFGGAQAQSPVSSGAILNASGTLGYFMTKEVELGAGQAVTYTSIKGSHTQVSTTEWGGQTNGFGYFHFDLGAWQPFLGGKLGYDYSAGATGSWYVAPVAGVKYFVNGTTFVFASLEYDYNLNHPSNGSSSYVGNLGIGFRF